MFVRRIATVTISAPEASIAARVCAKSRYLPVPTSSRERYALPATTRGSSAPMTCGSVTVFIARPRLGFGGSAAAHGGDNLDLVARGDSRLAVPALGDDLAVAFDSDPLALQGEFAHQVGDGHGAVAAMRSSVEDDREHGETAMKQVIILPRGRTAGGGGVASVAVLPQRSAQDANLLLEAGAGFAQEQMQANSGPLPGRDVPVLHLRDETARVLARDH